MYRRFSRLAVTTFVLSALFVPIASAQSDAPIADPLPTPGASGIGLELTEEPTREKVEVKG